MTARNRVVREPYATWCGRTPVEIIHGLLPDWGRLAAHAHPCGARPPAARTGEGLVRTLVGVSDSQTREHPRFSFA